LGNKKKKDFVKKNNKPEVLSKGEIMDLIKSKSGIENKSKVIKSSSEQ
jgi:IS4 transposase